MSLLSKKTLTKKLLTSRDFRKFYVWEQLKRSIPFQIRTMRDEREWSQERAGAELKKTQSLISRFESPAYGKMSLQTLVEIADGFDVGLLIKFVPFSRLVREYEDVSAEALSAKSVSDREEAAKLKTWGETIVGTTTASTETSGQFFATLESTGVTVRIDPNQIVGSATVTVLPHGVILPVTVSVPERKDNVLSPLVRGGTTRPTITAEKKAA